MLAKVAVASVVSLIVLHTLVIGGLEKEGCFFSKKDLGNRWKTILVTHDLPLLRETSQTITRPGSHLNPRDCILSSISSSLVYTHRHGSDLFSRGRRCSGSCMR